MNLATLTSTTLDLACAIQQIPAPTFHEHARAAFIRDHFLALGLQDVRIDDLANVYARRPGGAGKPVLVTAHLDTVFPMETPLTLERLPDRINGPGIGDNSLGVAGLSAVVRALADETLPGDLHLVANVGEEGLGDLRGMRRVVEELGARMGAIIVLEGMALGRVQYAAIGVRRYRFTARTEGGHSWHHFGRPSAIHVLVRLGAKITELAMPTHPQTTFNIGTITGGTSINTIAREASFDLDLRSEDTPTLFRLAKEVEDLAASFATPEVQIETQVIGNRPAGSIARDHPLLRLAAQTLADVGIKSTFEISSTDANIPFSLGLPCVCVGLAEGGHSHRPDEYIETRDLAQGLTALVALVRGAFTIPQ